MSKTDVCVPKSYQASCMIEQEPIWHVWRMKCCRFYRFDIKWWQQVTDAVISGCHMWIDVSLRSLRKKLATVFSHSETSALLFTCLSINIVISQVCLQMFIHALTELHKDVFIYCYIHRFFICVCSCQVSCNKACNYHVSGIVVKCWLTSLI